MSGAKGCWGDSAKMKGLFSKVKIKSMELKHLVYALKDPGPDDHTGDPGGQRE